ncbi:hypothetical protein PFTANZ_00937 [Plasmodium falciparum Tanzania (2000708)]|uniref:Plasmodium falciparum erythrocyte membrane protein 1 acidic terminal segment domain-containing protein n=1 Tax=Plasmodium falciparum Tanzania (2000708) TaxID=1036725 RepID=A0A024WBP0_PLAFA|nr:hypothetical protein PFTANZ_00937 [Plasmodium falciparum Tanzania (2000708)]
MEHNEQILGTPPSTNHNIDMNRIDEIYNIISTNNLYGHLKKTSFEHIGSTSIPYGDTPTQNNGLHTKNLHTSISMDINFDEKNINMDENNNNNVENTNVTRDDHLENLYNF